MTFRRNMFDLSTLEPSQGSVLPDISDVSLHQLFHPPPFIKGADAKRWVAEAHKRLSTPITALSYALVALLAVLTGPFRRQGSLLRPLISVVVIVGLLALGLALQSLAARNNSLLPLVWFQAIVPGLICSYFLFVNWSGASAQLVQQGAERAPARSGAGLRRYLPSPWKTARSVLSQNCFVQETAASLLPHRCAAHSLLAHPTPCSQGGPGARGAALRLAGPHRIVRRTNVPRPAPNRGAGRTSRPLACPRNRCWRRSARAKSGSRRTSRHAAAPDLAEFAGQRRKPRKCCRGEQGETWETALNQSLDIEIVRMRGADRRSTAISLASVESGTEILRHRAEVAKAVETSAGPWMRLSNMPGASIDLAVRAGGKMSHQGRELQHHPGISQR